jgi:hypothetical protein
MGKRVYRAIKNMEAFKEAAKNAQHIFVKNEDGTIFCETHQLAAEKCAPPAKGDLVYESSLDGGKYRLNVRRTKPYLGHLTLTRDSVVVLERDVGIMYDAPFGPDVEDIQTWQQLATEAADEDYRKRGEEPPAS